MSAVHPIFPAIMTAVHQINATMIIHTIQTSKINLALMMEITQTGRQEITSLILCGCAVTISSMAMRCWNNALAYRCAMAVIYQSTCQLTSMFILTMSYLETPSLVQFQALSIEYVITVQAHSIEGS
mmetsp:Transcript_197/g.349  ORF Transcript_197/g.349 Transcript_197/m.349 type:complete len:127 (-) Transcript_197:2833-3213(-)